MISAICQNAKTTQTKMEIKWVKTRKKLLKMTKNTQQMHKAWTKIKMEAENINNNTIFKIKKLAFTVKVFMTEWQKHTTNA